VQRAAGGCPPQEQATGIRLLVRVMPFQITNCACIRQSEAPADVLPPAVAAQPPRDSMRRAVGRVRQAKILFPCLKRELISPIIRAIRLAEVDRPQGRA
jgi:hypothetical protein